MFGARRNKDADESARAQALQADLDRLADENRTLAEALQAQTALADDHAAAATAAGYKAEMLQLAIAALQTRVDELETALYLARSDQQRSAVLADDLRARLTAQP